MEMYEHAWIRATTKEVEEGYTLWSPFTEVVYMDGRTGRPFIKDTLVEVYSEEKVEVTEEERI